MAAKKADDSNLQEEIFFDCKEEAECTEGKEQGGKEGGAQAEAAVEEGATGKEEGAKVQEEKKAPTDEGPGTVYLKVYQQNSPAFNRRIEYFLGGGIYHTMIKIQYTFQSINYGFNYRKQANTISGIYSTRFDHEQEGYILYQMIELGKTTKSLDQIKAIVSTQRAHVFKIVFDLILIYRCRLSARQDSDLWITICLQIIVATSQKL